MSKKEVLNAFKNLLKISQKTFEGDKRALLEARQRIHLEFRKDLSENETIDDKLKIAKDVGNILKHQVVQAVKNPETDNYELKLRQETAKLDNVIFKEDAVLPDTRGRKKCKPETS